MDSDLATRLLSAFAVVQSAEPTTPTDERILDAALAQFQAHGVRGTTVDDVATRAQVGRITVFRRFHSKAQLVEQVFARELVRGLAELDLALEPIADPLERIVEALVAAVQHGHRHPLLAQLLPDDPGVVLKRITSGEPSPFTVAREYTGALISEARPALAPLQLEYIADLLLRMLISYVLVPSSYIDLHDEVEVRKLARMAVVALVLSVPAE